MKLINKNILIIGAARSGKTTLAKKLCKEKEYSVISIDHIDYLVEQVKEEKVNNLFFFHVNHYLSLIVNKTYL